MGEEFGPEASDKIVTLTGKNLEGLSSLITEILKLDESQSVINRTSLQQTDLRLLGALMHPTMAQYLPTDIENAIYEDGEDRQSLDPADSKRIADIEAAEFDDPIEKRSRLWLTAWHIQIRRLIDEGTPLNIKTQTQNVA